MTLVKEFELRANTDQAVKNVDKLNDSLETTNSEVVSLKSSGKALDSLKKELKELLVVLK